MLLKVPVEGTTVLLVEVDRGDVPPDVTLASPGESAATARRSLSQTLEQLDPLLRDVRERLAASMPANFSVEFGVKFGGETGFILAKGTAEVNLKITMIWDRVTSGTDGRV